MKPSSPAGAGPQQTTFRDREDVAVLLELGPEEAPRRRERPGEERLAEGLAVAICTYKRAESLARFLASLAQQQRVPDELVVVDASPDEGTEEAVRAFVDAHRPAYRVCYVRVQGELRGLARQRNVSLGLVQRDVICFFDDDVVLQAGVLREVERAFREDEAGAFVGVGCVDQSSGFEKMPRRWRLRRRLGLWREEDVGRFSEAGMAVPWQLWNAFDDAREVDVLPGYAMCWRTAVLRSVGFDGGMVGYSLGEDIDIGLRTRGMGKKKLIGHVQVDHLHETSGRLSAYERGEQAGRNYCRLHARHGERSARARARFALWQFVDVARLLATSVRRPRNAALAAGRCAGIAAYLAGRE